MCTNYYLVKNRGSERLARSLNVSQDSFQFSRNFKPASQISIVIEDRNQTRQVITAIWWLYLQHTKEGFKPHPDYFSVNSTYSKLSKRPEYQKTRCIIPASGFVESQSGKAPHTLAPKDRSAIAFGGLFKRWHDKVSGESCYSAAIITLPGHPALADIHEKSTPLWLSHTSFDAWLDPNNTDTQVFEPLLTPRLHKTLIATPIDKTFTKKPIGRGFEIPKEDD